VWRTILSGAAALLLLSAAVEAGQQTDGPRITHLGIASISDFPVAPEPVEENGRRVYAWPQGFDFWLVIEAAPAADQRPLGVSTYAYKPGDPSVLPDLQVLVSNDLGNGNPAVCEGGDENVGIPAVPSLTFSETDQVAAAVNDLGCRFDDGTGQPLGRQSPDEACTKSPITFDPGFIDPQTTVQFCALIARPFPFPGGDTTVAARVRDTRERLSLQEEIVVRITGFDPTPTPTRPTPTPTSTSSSTPTATATPTPHCPGDCNRDGKLTIDELMTSVDVALDVLPITACPSVDLDHDAAVEVNELTAVVDALLSQCGRFNDGVVNSAARR